MKSSKPLSSSPADDAPSGPLLLKTADACLKLGGIHPRTLARMEARGLIHSIKLLRHRLYAVKDLEALVDNLRDWEA